MGRDQAAFEKPAAPVQGRALEPESLHRAPDGADAQQEVEAQAVQREESKEAAPVDG